MQEPYIGEVVQYAFNFAPQGWAPCAGQLLPIAQNLPLFQVIGSKFGGNGHTDFALPDYRTLTIPGLQYCIALSGIVPSPVGPPRPLGIGEIANLPYGFAPSLWVECNGQLLPIAGNEALFQAIGTNFGGDGKVNFGVPNLIEFSPAPPGPDTTSQYFIASEGGPAPVGPFAAEVRLFPFNAAPPGWETCAGQLLQIDRNQALFALLSFTFGGDGRVNFALPNMSGPPVPSGMEFCISIAGAFPTRSPQSSIQADEKEESFPDAPLPEEESGPKITG